MKKDKSHETTVEAAKVADIFLTAVKALEGAQIADGFIHQKDLDKVTNPKTLRALAAAHGGTKAQIAKRANQAKRNLRF